MHGSTRSPGSTRIRVHEVFDLRVGDVVDIRRWDTMHYRGAVDMVCPRLGVLWVLDGPLGERTLVQTDEYTVWKMVRPVRT